MPPTASRHGLTDQLRTIIDSRGLTAADLARETGLDPSVLSRFLRGEREVRSTSLDRIAAALGVRLVEVGRPARARTRRP